MRVDPGERRSQVERTAEGLKVSIPARRNIFLQVFLSFWLCGWFFGEFFAIRELLTGSAAEEPTLFLAGWLVLWTLGGATALFIWLWMLVGREIVTVGNGVLRVRSDLLGAGKVRDYDLAHVANVRVASATFYPFDPTHALQFWGFGGGPIAFDYGARTVRIGNGLDDAEARQVIADLRTAHTFLDQA